MSQKLASQVYGIPRGTLQNRIKVTHVSKVGRPPVLSDIEEKLLVDTIMAVTYTMVYGGRHVSFREAMSFVSRYYAHLRYKTSGRGFYYYR